MYIPPPFPFPEQWTSRFRKEQENPCSGYMWLTPFTPISRMYDSLPVPPSYYNTSVYNNNNVSNITQPSRNFENTIMHEDGESVASDDDEEAEYGYILCDEWRERFLQSRDRRAQKRGTQSTKPDIQAKTQRQRRNKY